MYSVFICDDDINLLETLARKIDGDPNFNVISRSSGGRGAINQIERLKPDIVILDIVMPDCDGVYITNYIRTKMNGYDPVIYILSGMSSTNIIKTLNDLDINFYSMKPVALDVVIQNLITLMRNRSIDEPERFMSVGASQSPQDLISDLVKSVALELGILPHRISAKCTIDALIYYLERPDSIHILTKVLYPQIAEKYGLNYYSVERNIRNAISTMQKADTALYTKIFSYSQNKRITNGEFLSVVSEYISKQVSLRSSS